MGKKEKKFKKAVTEMMESKALFDSAFGFLIDTGLVNDYDDIPIIFDEDVAEIDVFGTIVYITKDLIAEDNRKQLADYLVSKAKEVFESLKRPKDLFRRDKLISTIVRELTLKGYKPEVVGGVLKPNVDSEISITLLFTEEDNEIHGLEMATVVIDSKVLPEITSIPFVDADSSEDIVDKIIDIIIKNKVRAKHESEELQFLFYDDNHEG